jgi:hypothetical protein
MSNSNDHGPAVGFAMRNPVATLTAAASSALSSPASVAAVPVRAS